MLACDRCSEDGGIPHALLRTHSPCLRTPRTAVFCVPHRERPFSFAVNCMRPSGASLAGGWCPAKEIRRHRRQNIGGLGCPIECERIGVPDAIACPANLSFSSPIDCQKPTAVKTTNYKNRENYADFHVLRKSSAGFTAATRKPNKKIFKKTQRCRSHLAKKTSARSHGPSFL